MSTTFESIYETFFYKIENDKDFFVYYNLTPEEALVLAKQRAKNYLIESITRLVLSCSPEIDFSDYNDTAFNNDLTNNEINLLVQLMFEKYLERDVVKLRAFKVKFTPSDLNMFSPANERTSFMNMFDYVKYQSDLMIDRYSSRDRISGELKTIDYSSFEY